MTTASRFFEFNGTGKKFTDDEGILLEGQQVLKESLETGEITLLRFRDGMLDGDIYDARGNFVMQKPAVDAPGHQEYWRKNRLHRDNGGPAVITDGFRRMEWWENGERMEDKEET